MAHLLIALGALLIPFLARNIPESRVYTEVHDTSGHWKDLAIGPWAARFWVVIAVGFFASAFSAVGIAFATERMIDVVGLPTGSAVLILLLGGTLGGIGFFVGGHLADAWGRRRTSVLSLLLALVGGLLLYWTTEVPLIVFAVMISSFGTYAFVPAGGSHRAELFPTSLRASATTASSNFGLAGSAIGLILGIFTIDRIGVAGTVTLLGVGLALAALLTLLLPETRGQDLTVTPDTALR